MKSSKTMVFMLAAVMGAGCFLFTSCGKGNTPVSEIAGDKLLASAYINWFGRNYYDEDDGLSYFNYTAAGFEVKFKGTELTAELFGTQTGGHGDSYVSVFVDDEDEQVLQIGSGETKIYTLAQDLPEGEHTVKVLKRTEMQFTKAALKSIKTDGRFVSPPALRPLKLEFYGDSITAGYGSVSAVGANGFKTETQSGLHTYAYYTAEALGAQANILAYSGWTLNKGGTNGYSDIQIGSVYDIYSRDFKSADGGFVPWDFSKYIPDAVVVNIGANDNSYIGGNTADGKTFEQKSGEFTAKYIEFIVNLREAYSQAHIILVYGMLGETNTYEAVTRAVTALNMDGDHRVYSLKLYERTAADSGADGHPHFTAHLRAASQLTGFISQTVPG